VRTIALDSSAVVAWITQSHPWQQIQQLMDRPDVDIVLPGPTLTESIYIARQRGNVTAAPQIAATLATEGCRIELSAVADLVRAAQLHEISQLDPGLHARTGQPCTLSLGDALILAVVERVGCPVVTRDRYWADFARGGHTTATVRLA